MRQFLTPSVLANQVRMQRSAFQGAFVFVEGDSDERLYSLLFNSDTCKIIVANCRPQLLEIRRILDNSNFSGFLCIADADFDHLNKITPPNSLVLTDWHDMECYLFKSTALNRVLHEYADKEKFENWKHANHVSDISMHLVTEVSRIGYLLWYSLNTSLELNFKGIDFEKITQKDTLLVDENQLLNQVLQHSSSPHLCKVTIQTGIQSHKLKSVDLWQVARGHDIVHLLCFALKTVWKRSSASLLSSSIMEGVLRTAYPVESFSKTDLFMNIRQWEFQNGMRFKILNN